MVLIVSPRNLPKVEKHLRQRRATFFEIGEVTRGPRAVRYRGSWA